MNNACLSCETVFDHSSKKARIETIDKAMAGAGFWDHQELSQQKVIERKSLMVIVQPLDEVSSAVNDLADMMELAEEEPAFEAEIPGELGAIEKSLDDLEMKALLGGNHDNAGAIIAINARDGGTDANDWAEMLLRMYAQWAQKNDCKAEILDRNDNEEAGINSAAIAIRGPFAYGYLKGETGMHRLVRISPFNAEGKRQTSFAAVDVSPEISDIRFVTTSQALTTRAARWGTNRWLVPAVRRRAKEVVHATPHRHHLNLPS